VYIFNANFHPSSQLQHVAGFKYLLIFACILFTRKNRRQSERKKDLLKGHEISKKSDIGLCPEKILLKHHKRCEKLPMKFQFLVNVCQKTEH